MLLVRERLLKLGVLRELFRLAPESEPPTKPVFF